MIKIDGFAENYFEELKSTIDKISLKDIETVKNILYSAYEKNKQIFVLGNGGSASLASHFACDLGKGTLERHYGDEKRFKVTALDNLAIITAYANDVGYEEVFVQQLKNLVNPGDVVLAISGSGNSENVLKAIEYASRSKAVTIGFTGFDGGKLRDLIDYEIHVPSDNYGVVEDIHTILTHLVSSNLAEIKKGKNISLDNKSSPRNINYVKEIKQAVILAGGLGTRLKPFTNTSPKPMIPIRGKPFLEYLINMLRENGIKEVVLLLGYLPEKIQEYFGDGSRFGINIKYSIGDVEFDTAKRIKHAKGFLDENFLLMYCDNYWPLNLKELLKFHNSQNKPFTVTAFSNKDNSTRSNMLIKEGKVIKYDKSRQEIDVNGVDIGFFILNKKILDYISDENLSFGKDIFPILVGKNELSGYLTDHKYYSIGGSERLPATEKFLKEKKVIFLDRDGVINKKAPKADYIKKWSEFEFIEGAKEAIAKLTKNNYKIFIISNQAGIARGMMTKQDLEDIHNNMKEELAKCGAKIDGIYYCPHGWDGGCECRKPKPGMFYQAAKEHHIDLTKTIFIGDDERDVEAGQAADIKTYLVKPGDILRIINSILEDNNLFK